jgi:excisionase family DNA binding protein
LNANNWSEAAVSPVLLDLKQAGDALSLGKTTLFSLIRDGRLKTVKIGRRTLIPIEAVHQFVETLREANA